MYMQTTRQNASVFNGWAWHYACALVFNHVWEGGREGGKGGRERASLPPSLPSLPVGMAGPLVLSMFTVPSPLLAAKPMKGGVRLLY